jgi:hypothetical protein
MLDRGFSEIELREMLHRARAVRPDSVKGRWIAETSHKRRSWLIILEPDPEAQSLVVVTAYPAE